MHRAPNNHFTDKSYGNCTYKGPLENLPVPETFDLEAAIEGMYTDGYCIVPGVLNREEVAELRAFMDSMGGDDAQYHVKNWCYNKHISSEFHKDPRYLKYIDLPGVIDVLEAVHGPGCHVSGGTSWITGAGREMGIHVDWLPFNTLPQEYLEDPRVRIPVYKSTAHIYLNDMQPNLGPTTLIPGSHMSGRAPKDECTWNGVTPKAVMVKAGDVALFRTEVWHGAWRNTNEQERRYMMQVFYGFGVEGHGYPPMRYASLWNTECLQKATPRQRKLLGG
ncbi:MAG: phytanoyl-CoA dioxygenase family protein [Planctomycetes bacterium]|nr:phytanoyl-CoA dioxygenase family protein [Planctomycetota bacterium]